MADMIELGLVGPLADHEGPPLDLRGPARARDAWGS
jgi:hypothetical protein